MSEPLPDPLVPLNYSSAVDRRRQVALLAAAGTLAPLFSVVKLDVTTLWEMRLNRFSETPMLVTADWVDDASLHVLLVGCLTAGIWERYVVGRVACLLAAAMTSSAWAVYTVHNFRFPPSPGSPQAFQPATQLMISNGLECLCKTVLPAFAWYLLRSPQEQRIRDMT